MKTQNKTFNILTKHQQTNIYWLYEDMLSSFQAAEFIPWSNIWRAESNDSFLYLTHSASVGLLS